LFADPNAASEIARLAAAASGGSARAELALTTAPEEPRRLSISPLPKRDGYALWSLDEGGAPTGLEHALREELRRISGFTSDVAIGFYSLDERGRFHFADDTVAGWLGLEASELVDGRHALTDFLTTNGKGAGDIAALTEAPHGEITLKGADGREINAAFSQAIVPIADGSGFRTRSMLRDLGANSQRQGERDRRRGEGFMHLFYDAPMGMVLLDAKGEIVDCNTAFGRMFFRGAGKSKGVTLVDLIADDDRARVAGWLENLVDGAQPSETIEVGIAAGEGSASLFAGRRDDDSGADLVLLALPAGGGADIEEKLVQSLKLELVGQLAGGVAHDFNNLLTAMIGFCDLLLMRHSPKDQSFADIIQIKQNANRAANLVRQLLAFSRQQTLQPRVLDITDVLAELSHLLRRLIGAEIELNMVHDRELGLVKVDQGQFDQVIINLAVNARDAMEDGGTLTIETERMPGNDSRLAGYDDLPVADYVAIRVIDSGCGIPKDLLDKIYEPFFTTKEVGSGTGLGLATVYGIVKQTGGHIYVDSVPDTGTTFTIFLPEYSPEAEAPGEAVKVVEETIETPADTTGAGTVLLVEDEEAVRLFGARALRNKGYTIIEAKNGEEALEVLGGGEADQIELLITDVVMPGVDGPTLIREVRKTRPELKVIFISGYTEDSFRQRLDEGVEVHFLPKPFSLSQLAGMVKEVMEV